MSLAAALYVANNHTIFTSSIIQYLHMGVECLKPLASTHDSTVTDDGWTLKLDATELTVNPLHNLANSPFSREGEFTAKVAGTISGTGTESAQSAIVEQYLILGCQVDASSGLAVGLTGSIGPNVGVSIGATGPSANLGAQVVEVRLGNADVKGIDAPIRGGVTGGVVSADVLIPSS